MGDPAEGLLQRLSIANDASHYSMTPRSTSAVDGIDAIRGLLAAAVRDGMAVTFRSGGTSLSGQAVTDAHLADTRRHFRGVEVLEGGALVRALPGSTVRAVNVALRGFGRRIGPDPASDAACTIGGVVANNSSGMTCGVDRSAYATLEALTLVLASGTVVDTADPEADALLRDAEPHIHAGLLALRDRIRSDPRMVGTVRRLFAMKNTMGYNVNAFLDHDRPADILARLVVGSEGTLAFVASATFRTLSVLPHAQTALLLYPSLDDAVTELADVVRAGPEAVELLDARALVVAAAGPRAAPELRASAGTAAAALLVEFQADSAAQAEARVRALAPSVVRRAGPTGGFTADPGRRAALWASRKDLYAAVAGARRPGTTALLEDVAVPVPALPHLCRDLSALFDTMGYEGSVIFGHAKDGNVHFMITEDFTRAECVDRYAAFTEAMVESVLALGGTLKAEHGTGRVMAPFVRRQYGDDLYDVMRQVKDLLDPHAVLNPGVIINDRPQAHLESLKVPVLVDPAIDGCVECGFCEPVCPSRDLTLTPRQRIVALRAIERTEVDGDRDSARELAARFGYAGVETCAADGMCQTACPVGIDTGALVRELRAESAGGVAEALGVVAARHWSRATRAAATALTAARKAPGLAQRSSSGVRRLLPGAPQWAVDLPGGGRPRSSLLPTGGRAGAVVFFPSCTGAVFGATPGAAQAFASLCAKAGVDLRIPESVDQLCCGMPWSSKGLTRGAEHIAGLVSQQLRELSEGERLRVLVDASSCAEGLRKLAAGQDHLEVEDVTAFVARELLPRLDVRRGDRRLAVHPTCSAVRMGTDADLLRVAGAISADVFVPQDWGCCGFAGDRGLSHPELTKSATRRQAEEVRASGAVDRVSCNRTCEVAMTRAVGSPYRHVLELLDEVSTARDHRDSR